MKNKVRVTLVKGKSFVSEIVSDSKGNMISKRTQTMTGILTRGNDGMHHLHRNSKGYYVIDPTNIKSITELKH